MQVSIKQVKRQNAPMTKYPQQKAPGVTTGINLFGIAWHGLFNDKEYITHFYLEGSWYMIYLFPAYSW